MRRHLPFILAIPLLAACAPGPLPQVQGPDGTLFQRMTVERLPELNAPRGGHQTLLLGEDLTVIGGHTDGFKLIETAEYLRGGDVADESGFSPLSTFRRNFKAATGVNPSEWKENLAG